MRGRAGLVPSSVPPVLRHRGDVIAERGGQHAHPRARIDECELFSDPQSPSCHEAGN